MVVDAFLDPEGRYEIGQEVLPVDALKFKDSRKYPERLKEALENTGETDALVVIGGSVHSINLVVACFEAKAAGAAPATIRLGSSRTSSLANSGRRLTSPSA